jgi:hypothetical protein
LDFFVNKVSASSGDYKPTRYQHRSDLVDVALFTLAVAESGRTATVVLLAAAFLWLDERVTDLV